MNRRLLAVFSFALLVASGTSFMFYRLIVLHVRAPGKPLATSKLIVAAHDLQIGALIHDVDLTEVAWSDPIPDQAIRSRQDASGRGVLAPIFQNEPILDRRLAPKGAGAGLAATIPVGMRAVALRVNDVVGLAGFVLPGMRVDVLIAGNAPGVDTSKTGSLCKTVLQNIEVLSAGQSIEKSAEGKPGSAQVQVVNLLVTPDQAEILNLASDETKVQLVLRNPLDNTEEKTHGSSVAGLFGQPIVAPLAVAAVKPPHLPIRSEAPHRDAETNTIEVFSGAKRSEEKFGIPQEKN